jgi:hypothetical protein
MLFSSIVLLFVKAEAILAEAILPNKFAPVVVLKNILNTMKVLGKVRVPCASTFFNYRVDMFLVSKYKFS